MSTVELERKVTAFERRLINLEKTVADLVGEKRVPPHITYYSIPVGSKTEPALSHAEQEMLNPQQLLAWMRTEGLIIDPPSEYLAYGERWRALPEAEKRDILWDLDHVTSGPMASEIISEGRR